MDNDLRTPWTLNVDTLEDWMGMGGASFMHGLVIFDSSHRLVALVHGKTPEEQWNKGLHIVTAVNMLLED